MQLIINMSSATLCCYKTVDDLRKKWSAIILKLDIDKKCRLQKSSHESTTHFKSRLLIFWGFFFQFLDINVFKFFKTVQKDIVKFKLHFKFYYGYI